MTETKMKSGVAGLASQLPMDRLKQEAQNLGQALTERGLAKASGRVESLTGKLNDYAQGGGTMPKMAKNLAEGDSPAKAGLKATASKVTDTVKSKLGGKAGGKAGGKGDKIKVTNILESVDVPVSREVAYQQWTQFEEFPTFMKKVENVKQEADEKLKWQAQIFWSHRTWESTIVDQVPNERIVWKSEGAKGHADGAVTFHELAPDLTRILMVLEYHPKGLFEHTGNLWRAQGRRARLELKHFARHVSTRTLLGQDELEGWEGEIHEGKVQESSDQDQEADESQESGEQGQAPGDQGESADQDEAGAEGEETQAASASDKQGQEKSDEDSSAQAKG